MKLKTVGFSLKGAAEVWYGNNQRDCRALSELKVKFVAAFGQSAVRKLEAEQRLRVRAQQAGDNFISYTEDIVNLCKCVDPSMSEAYKVTHILKGIDVDAFEIRLSKDLSTVVDIVKLSLSIHELRKDWAYI